MEPSLRNAMREGLADAVGFVVGALAGWWLGAQFGFDFVRSAGYDAKAMVGLVFIALGCGAGRWLARRWILRR
ncbi:MAG TPA: hypothetical protein VFR90_03585 [Methylibium sp.]|uniref:hypothetical protein n=1 Tax=Methylibium sp. TaxID=2067992 RepID=UPI002DBA9624|nr:hypothetical protein [Methylibium sp.]HEU4458181.1 hypothetical protein [Methylibium sp.]